MAALYPTLSTLNPRSRRRIFAQRMSPSTSFKSKAFLHQTEMFTMADFSLATCPKNLFKLGHKLFICEIYHDPPLMSCQLKRERLGWFWIVQSMMADNLRLVTQYYPGCKWSNGSLFVHLNWTQIILILWIWILFALNEKLKSKLAFYFSGSKISFPRASALWWTLASGC